MRLREGFATCLLVLVGVGIGSTLKRPTAAQVERPVRAGQIGRYQMMVSSEEPSCALVTDTATGHAWSHRTDMRADRYEFGVPPKK